MKIKEVSTTQFAGIKDKSMSFSDGMNVVIGENESGKSTMLEIIKQTLFKKTALTKKSVEDKKFYSMYMPSDGKGDYVDGKVVFEGKDGPYELEKVWGSISLFKMKDPSGATVAGEDKHAKDLEDALMFKKGLYDEVVFASQKDEESVVEQILADKKGKGIDDIVSSIAAESLVSAGGILPKDVEQIIKDKLDKLGDNWDFSANAPRKDSNNKPRDIDNKWGSHVGGILAAYYDMAEAEQGISDLETMETAIKKHNADIDELKSKKGSLEDEREEFDKFAEAIANLNSGKELEKKYKDERAAVDEDKKNYPDFLTKREEAGRLQGLVDAGTAINRYKAVKGAKEASEQEHEKLKGCVEVTKDDVDRLDNIERSIDKKQKTLNGLNVVANINKLGNSPIEIRSLLTGELFDCESGNINIDDAVEITIPGVVRITLAPGGVDVEKVEEELKELESERKAIFDQTGAKDRDELEKLRTDYESQFALTEKAQKSYDEVLGEDNYSAIEEEYNKNIGHESELDGLDVAIQKLCCGMSLESFIATNEADIRNIEKKYAENDTMGDIERRLSEIDENLQKLKEKGDLATNIPEKYRDVTDTAEFRNEIKRQISDIEEKIENMLEKINDEKVKMGDNTVEDLEVKKNNAESLFIQKKQEYQRWGDILDVLYQVRDSLKTDGAIDDIQKRFADYLSIISDGGVSLDSMDEGMNLSISSKNFPMTYDHLSEGTKGTIGLAFRLAMLEHIFPDGNGFAVFDDPFTDMSPERTKKSCELITEFAKRNQVIFVTCDDKYRELLKGNIIEMK